MSQFKFQVINAFRPESGINLAMKGLEEKMILAPHMAYYFEKAEEGNALNLTFSPSSGNTESRQLQVEIKNGTEKTTTAPNQWSVELTATAADEAVEAIIQIAQS